MQKITPFLWFDNNAEEAMNFYVSVFRNAKILDTTHLPDLRTGGKESFLIGTIQIEGQNFMVMNGGPHYTFTPAISLFVNCENQQEVDELWAKLSLGGAESRCGWLTDKFGLSWQIIPENLGRLLHDKEHPEKAQRAMQAMLQMSKINIADLEAAYNGTKVPP